MAKFNAVPHASYLFAPPVVEFDRHIVERHVPKMLEHYHQCLKRHLKPLAFAMNVLGLSRDTINASKIGFVDRSLPLQFPYHKTVEGRKLRGALIRLRFLAGTGHEIMRGCLTLPLFSEDNQVGMCGLRYDRPRRDKVSFKCTTFCDLPIFGPSLSGSVAMLCNTPFTVLALAERGYKNGFAVLGTDVTAFTLAELVKKGVTSVVVFTDATSDETETTELRTTLRAFGLTLCEVPLPFVVENLGKWEEYQWQLFDKRLTRVLKEKGLRNERYQA
ncbi:hypothetical protein OAP14_02590 [Aliiglaciecola sp.]|nr:hypothetical protein [Aliiglaciecola sp.]